MPAIETWRAVVAMADCDVLGHMNVARYFAACSDGVLTLQGRLGLGIADMTGGRRLSFAVVRNEAEFKAEVRAGEVLALETGIVELGGKSVLFRHRMRRAEPAGVVFETLFRCVLLDLRTRRAVAVPADIRALAAEFMVEDAG